jgi:hypothetical protein
VLAPLGIAAVRPQELRQLIVGLHPGDQCVEADELGVPVLHAVAVGIAEDTGVMGGLVSTGRPFELGKATRSVRVEAWVEGDLVDGEAVVCELTKSSERVLGCIERCIQQCIAKRVGEPHSS